MAILELIDRIDELLSGGAPLGIVRNQLIVLREQVEALEQRGGVSGAFAGV